MYVCIFILFLWLLAGILPSGTTPDDMLEAVRQVLYWLLEKPDQTIPAPGAVAEATSAAATSDPPPSVDADVAVTVSKRAVPDPEYGDQTFLRHVGESA